MNLKDEVKQLRESLKESEHVQTELDRKVFYLKTLYDVSKDIFGSVEFETILRNFLLMTLGNFGVMEGFILTLDRPSKGIVHLVSLGFSEGDHQALRDGGRELLLREIAEGQLVSGRDLAKLGILPAEVTGALPFTIESDYVGLLGLGSKLVGEPYSEDDKELLTTLVNNLVVALKNAISRDLSNFYQRAAALNVTLDALAHTGPIIAQSRKMRKVEEEIAILSKQQGPILISGGQGTGKAFVAAKIHDAGMNPEGPFMVIDCRSLAEGEVGGFLFGSLRFRKAEEEHSSGLESLQHYGAIHLANQGMLVLKHIDALPADSQEDLVRYLENLRDGFLAYPNVRVICTAREDLKTLSGERGLVPALAAQLSSSAINLPSLRDRRKDILPLAQLFLEESDGDKQPRISSGAEHVIVSRRYNHSNVVELREAVEIAAVFAEGQEILAEHIFTGPKQEGTPLEYDLGQIPLIRWLVSDRVLSTFRWTVFGVFSAIVFLSLITAGTKAGNIANSLIWGLWWPVLIFSFLFVGRLWCTVCPISTAGRCAFRIKSLDQPPSGWLKKYSGWLIPLGFLSIIWFEHTFHMTQHPAASGILLLSLMTAAVLFSMVYQRETWCRYLCPIGNLGAISTRSRPRSA
ncbi:MAG TPA: 4Fe-4S binding protein [Desulfobacterales bacterium]|nr:4Fe-4S binding protein [Desulfobacterales bacterium]